MAQIYVPIISPFSITGPSHEADDSHIQSHHVAYEIAFLSRKLNNLLAEYESRVLEVSGIQAEYRASTSSKLAKKLQKVEKSLLSSMLPHEIKTVRRRLKSLTEDLMVLTSPR